MPVTKRWGLQNKLLILFLLIALYIIYFTGVSLLRHDNLYSRRLDLGNMDQTVWNVLHGNGFTMTDPSGTNQLSRLAVHADFLLIFLAPFYLLWSNPKMLLVIQTIVLALGAIPVYLLAAQTIKSRNIALLFAAAYLLYPPLQRSNLYDFHAVALSTTLLLWAFWFLYQKKYWWFILFGVLAALGKEEVWLTIGLMGLYLSLINKKKILGISIAAASFMIFFILLWYVIPAVSPGKQHFALTFFSEFGTNQNDILLNILKNPSRVIQIVLLPDRLYYLTLILLPVGFYSLLAPQTLVFAMPTLAINLLSNNWLMQTIDYQYNSIITPFVFISGVFGFAKVYAWCNIRKPHDLILRNLPMIWLVGSVVFTAWFWGELPGMQTTRFFLFTTPQPESQMVRRVARQIDARYSVSVSNNIGAHFSQRQYLWNFPVNYTIADYVVINLGDPFAWPSDEEHRRVLIDLQNDEHYTRFIQYGQLYVFKRKGVRQ